MTFKEWLHMWYYRCDKDNMWLITRRLEHGEIHTTINSNNCHFGRVGKLTEQLVNNF